MKKLFLLMVLSFIFKGSAFSQQPSLWQSLPIDFNATPWVMYYDSTTDASYIGGYFTMVGDSVCNIVKLDQNADILYYPRLLCL